MSSLEKRLQEIEVLAGKGDKRRVTVFSEEPGKYYTLDGDKKVPVSLKQLGRLKASAIVTLVVLQGCEEHAEKSGVMRIVVTSHQGMILTGRLLAGERPERAERKSEDIE